jgi:hypothetical protein
MERIGVAHCQTVQDFIKGLLCLTSYYKKEVHIKDYSRQQKHGSHHIYWYDGQLKEEQRRTHAVLL